MKTSHYLLFTLIGNVIAVIGFLLGKNIHHGSVQNFMLNLFYVLYPLALVIIMIRTYRSENKLSYLKKFLPSLLVTFSILIVIVLLNLFNISGRTLTSEDIQTGLLNISVVGIVQLIFVSGLAAIPSKRKTS